MNKPNAQRRRQPAVRAKLPKHSLTTLPVILRNLPADPAVVNRRPTREGTIASSFTMVAGTVDITSDDVIARIRDFLWGATGGFHYQILSIRVWGRETGAEQIEMVDSDSNVTASDLGSATFRAKVGFTDPPLVQARRIRASADSTATLYTVLSTIQTGTVDARITVRVWSNA